MTDTELLAALLSGHFFVDVGELEWRWREGVKLSDKDPSLNDALLEFIKRNNLELQ